MMGVFTWLFMTRGGRLVIMLICAVVAFGVVWKHGYDTHATSSRQKVLEEIAKNHERRGEIENEISDNSLHDLCDRLGGGVWCDDLE